MALPRPAGLDGHPFSMQAPKVLGLAMTFVLGVLLLILVWVTYLHYQDHLATARQATADAANALAEHLLRTMEGSEQLLYRAAALADGLSWEQVAGSRPLWEKLRAAAASSADKIRVIWLADPSGKVRIITSEFPAPALNIAQRSYFRRTMAQDQGFQVGNPRLGAVTGKPYFSLAVPLLGSDGKARGVVAGAVAPPHLDQLTKFLGQGHLVRAELVTLEGVVLTQAPAEGWRLGSVIGYTRVKTWLKQQVSRASYQSRAHPGQGERLVAFKRLESLPLAVVVSTPLEAVNGSFWRENWPRLAFSLLVIGLIALVFLALIRRAKILAATTVSLDAMQQEMKARHLAESQSRESSLAYRAIYENLIDGLALLDLDGRVLDCNRAFLRRYGYTTEEMQGRDLGELVGAAQPGPMEEILQAAAQGRGVHLESRDRRKNGEEFFSEINTTLITMGGERVLLTILRDVTLRKQAEDKRERLLMRLEALWEMYRHISDSEADIQEKAMHTMLRFTGARYAFLGWVDQDRQELRAVAYSPEVYAGCRADQDQIHLPLAQAGLWAEALRRGGPHIINNYAVTASRRPNLPPGHVDIFNFMSVPVLREGETAGLVCLANKPGGFDDEDELMVESFATGLWLILERKGLVLKLREKAELLERSNDELKQFAYVASHDLQEPLRMVSSYVQLLKRRYGGKLDQDAEEFIDYAVDGAERMRKLIQDLLAFSRVTTKGRPLEPTDSGEALRAALTNLQMLISDTGAKVEAGEMPRVRADQGQLAQVFQNLVHNAIKFHGPQPPLVRIQAQAQEEDGRWLFSVSDNGVGIEEQYFERIFIIYQRLHSKADYGGTGIGLALVKKIVERHGGRVWVESRPGQGTTFYFTLAPE